jgi:hypothetical protein
MSPTLFEKIDTYVKQHGNTAVLNDENFCERKFAIGTYICPQAVGNRMNEFLNAFAGAFITNRTLVWRICMRKHCQYDNEDDCAAFLTRLPWIVSFETVYNMWKSKNCVGYELEYHLIQQKFRGQSEQILICCGIDKLVFPFLNYGTHEMHEMFSLVLNQTRLEDVNKQRAQLLFEFGDDFGYGVLLRSSFEFNKNVIEKNDQSIAYYLQEDFAVENEKKNKSNVIKSQERGSEVLHIGLHSRHSSSSDEDGVEYGEMECVKKVLEKYSQFTNSCVLMLASDRSKQIELWQKRTKNKHELNCTLIVSNHTYAVVINRFFRFLFCVLKYFIFQSWLF